jgi:hypothetical protein
MKTRWWQSGVALLVLLAFGLRGRADTGETWKTFTDPENRFSILMPSDPQVTNESGPQGAAKPTYTSHIYMAKENNNLYLAGITFYDPSSYDPSATPDQVEKELAADRDNFNKAVNAHITSQQRRKFGDYPAIEFTSSNADANFSGLIILVGTHCYMAVAAYHTPDTPAEVTRFFESYKLISP